MKSLIEKMFIKLNYPKIVRGGRFCIAVPSDITEVEKRAFYDVINLSLIHISYVKIDKDSKSQFLNLETNEVDAVYSNKEKIVFINNNLIASVNEKKPLFGKEYEYVAIQKFPSTEVLLEEKGYFIGAIAANSDTTYIFLK